MYDPSTLYALEQQHQRDLIQQAQRRRLGRLASDSAPQRLRVVVGTLLIAIGARLSGREVAWMAGPELEETRSPSGSCV